MKTLDRISSWILIAGLCLGGLYFCSEILKEKLHRAGARRGVDTDFRTEGGKP